MPYIKEVCEAALALGYKHLYVHICGEHNLNLPLGHRYPSVTRGSSVSVMKLSWKQQPSISPMTSSWATWKTAIIQTGTPQQVYEATERWSNRARSCLTVTSLLRLRIAAKAPIENIKAITQAVNDFGGMNRYHTKSDDFED